MPIVLNFAERAMHFPKQTGVPIDREAAAKDPVAAMARADALSALKKGEEPATLGRADTGGLQRAGDVVFPAKGRTAQGNPFLDADGGKRPSETEVSEATLKAMREHRVAKGWFGPGGLVVKEPDSAPAAKAPKGG